MALTPLNNTNAEVLAELTRKVQTLETTRQPYISDWIEYTEKLSRDSSSVLSTSIDGVDLTTIFSVGDKLRLKIAGGSYLYFYIIEVTATTIKVNGGSDYSLTAGDVSDVAYSRLANPVGHPMIFNYSPTYKQYRASKIAFSPTTNEAYYYMNGTNVFLFVSFTGTVTDVSTYVFVSLPFTLRTGSDNERTKVVGYVGGAGTSYNHFLAKAWVGTNVTTPLVNARPDNTEFSLTQPDRNTGFGDGTSLDVDFALGLDYIY